MKTEIVSLQGMEYLHSVDIKYHGHLSSSKCVVDNRWMLKITDYGLREFRALRGDSNSLPRGHNYQMDYSSMLQFSDDCLC